MKEIKSLKSKAFLLRTSIKTNKLLARLIKKKREREKGRLKLVVLGLSEYERNLSINSTNQTKRENFLKGHKLPIYTEEEKGKLNSPVSIKKVIYDMILYRESLNKSSSTIANKFSKVTGCKINT